MILDVQQRDLEPDVTVLEFSGRLLLGNDLGLAEHRIRKQVEQGRKNLVFDFSNVVSIDSAGLGMVLMISSLARQTGGQFRLVAPGPKVASVLKMARVYEMLSVHADLEAALASLTSDPAAGGQPASSGS